MFRNQHILILTQSLVFEKMNEGNFGDTLTLMNLNVRSNINAFRSDQLTINAKSPNKMMYDSIRVFGLRITAEIDITLIRLSQNPDDPQLRKRLVQLITHLCNNTMLLKSTDSHLKMNMHHLNYSKAKFSDVIERIGLLSAFDMAL